jgi:O-antigen ligase
MNQLKSFFIILFFGYISFLAPIVNICYWNGCWNLPNLFLFILIFFLFISFGYSKEFHRLVFNKETIMLWVFFLAIAAGLINAKEPTTAYKWFWFSIFPLPFLFFLTRISFEKKYALLIIRSLCLMATLVSIYGIIALITKYNFIYEYFSNNPYYKTFEGIRILSFHIHSTPFGTYLVAIFPLAVILLLKEKNKFLKLLAIFCISVILTSLILTFSRGVLLGFCAEMLILILFAAKGKRRFFITGAMLLIVLLISISTLIGQFNYLSFFRYSLQGLSTGYTYSAKIARFIMTGQILKEHPFVGIGFGHFRMFFDHYLPNLAKITSMDSKVADCMYFTILAETGIIGFSGFILFVLSLLKKVLKALRSELLHEDKLFLLGFLCGFIGIMCSFLTYDGLYWMTPNYLFWGYAGILSAFTIQDVKTNHE